MSSLNALGVLYENMHFPKPLSNKSNISKRLNFVVPNILASSTIPYIIVKPTHTHNPLSMHFVGFFVLYQEKQDSARSLYSKQNLSRKQTNLGTYVVFIPPFTQSFNSFVYVITSHSEKLLRTLGRKETLFFFVCLIHPHYVFPNGRATQHHPSL